MNRQLPLFPDMQRPMYVVEEEKLERNLSLIREVAHEADMEIILAFKAFALWKTFPYFRQYISSTTASSLSEARLAMEEFGAPAHTYSPAYTPYEIEDIARLSSHLTFNSLTQYGRYRQQARRANPDISIGLRVNPEYSEVETLLYNPCAPGSRFGITADKLPQRLPEDVEGFHCHCHCESGPEVFERTLQHIEKRFAPWFAKLKWINFGGGHLMTRNDYSTLHLINIIKGFHKRYPHLKVIMEPGSAFAWQTGFLLAHVVDIVEDHGLRTAILDVSFTCHMPDCLEMPYWPQVRGAVLKEERSLEEKMGEGREEEDTHGGLLATSCTLKENSSDNISPLSPHSSFLYRLGGNSCLSGDFMGCWAFGHELQVGEEVILEDMIHYTTVKTNTFNGIAHPAIAMLHKDGKLEMLRKFTYEDYRDRMD